MYTDPSGHDVLLGQKYDTTSASTKVSSSNSISKPLVIKGAATLKIGSKGEDVKSLQKFLGFKTEDCDGKFGPKTKSAVVQYQKDHGLKDDGIVGNNTRNMINGVTASNTSSKQSQGSTTTTSKTSTSATSKISMTWPAPDYPYKYSDYDNNDNSNFGVDRGDHKHSGIDIGGIEGDRVFAASSGKITRIDFGGGDKWGSGNQIHIKYTIGETTIITKYLHLQAGSLGYTTNPNITPRPWQVDDVVKAGDLIARVGGTRGPGLNPFEPHLHFTVIENNVKVDPLNYFR